MKYTPEEIKAAKETRKVIIEEGIETLQAIFMAGEICMWEESKVDWKQLREQFFKDLVRIRANDTVTEFNCMPHNVFEWFKNKLNAPKD